MKKHTYKIDDTPYIVELDDEQEYFFGEEKILSNEESDITYFQSWHDLGYTIENFLDDNQFSNLKKGVTDCIKNIIENVLNIKNLDFDLERYHEIISNNDDHYRVVSITRDLFPKDFGFPINEIIPIFEDILKFKLTDVNPNDNLKSHIILRINRPNSNDYNPPHKDVYEHYDEEKYVPKFVNFWVPICGVTKKSMLPISPKTHKLPENLILRTNEESFVSGNKYRVRAIKEWDNSVSMYRYPIDYGQVLIFSPHLIHGLAVNEEKNITRVSLEFRLYKYE